MRNGTCSLANSGSRNCVWRNVSLWSSYIVRSAADGSNRSYLHLLKLIPVVYASLRYLT